MEHGFEERFMQLEIKLAYLEDFVRKIQDTTVSQGKFLDFLKAENKVLRQKLAELAADREESPAHTRPPHY